MRKKKLLIMALLIALATPAMVDAASFDLKTMKPYDVIVLTDKTAQKNFRGWTLGYMAQGNETSDEQGRYFGRLWTENQSFSAFTIINSPQVVAKASKKKETTIYNMHCQTDSDVSKVSAVMLGHISFLHGDTIINTEEIEIIGRLAQLACQRENTQGSNVFNIYERLYMAARPYKDLKKNSDPNAGVDDNTVDIKKMRAMGFNDMTSKELKQEMFMWLLGYVTPRPVISNEHSQVLGALLNFSASDSILNLISSPPMGAAKINSPAEPLGQSCQEFLQKDQKGESTLLCCVMEGYLSKKHNSTIINFNAIRPSRDFTARTCQNGDPGNRNALDIYEEAYLAARRPKDAKLAAAPATSQAKSEAAPDKGGKEASPAIPQESDISARALYRAFEENEVAANKRYMDKKIVVSGEIEEISTDFTGDPEITLSVGDFEFGGVVCEMESDDGVEKLRKKQTITLTGKVAGYALGFVQMEECEIMK